MKNFEDIQVSIKDYIAQVTINRPPNNFFDFSLIGQIAEAFSELDGMDSCRVIILCSNGKHFCAGANFVQVPIFCWEAVHRVWQLNCLDRVGIKLS